MGIAPDHTDTSGLVVRPWVGDRLVARLPRRWPLGVRRSAMFGALWEHPMAGLPRDSGLSRFPATQASRSGRVPRHRVRLGGFKAVAQMVAAGAGWAMVPEAAALRYSEGRTRMVALSDDWANRQRLVCTAPQSPPWEGVRTLADALAAACTRPPGDGRARRDHDGPAHPPRATRRGAGPRTRTAPERGSPATEPWEPWAACSVFCDPMGPHLSEDRSEARSRPKQPTAQTRRRRSVQFDNRRWPANHTRPGMAGSRMTSSAPPCSALRALNCPPCCSTMP